jgi:hypothetical protein
LERFRGWHGILDEPMQELYEICRDERPNATVIRAALVPADHDGDTVRMQFPDLMSTVAGEHEDEWRTHMGNVLGWRDPRWILVEVHDQETGRPPIEEILGDRYVLDRSLSPLDLLYRRADVAH